MGFEGIFHVSSDYRHLGCGEARSLVSPQPGPPLNTNGFFFLYHTSAPPMPVQSKPVQQLTPFGAALAGALGGCFSTAYVLSITRM